jgi:hypothetical protein
MPDRIDRPPNVAIGATQTRGKASSTAHRALGRRVAQGIADGAAAIDLPHDAAARIDIPNLKLRLPPDANRDEVARRFREALVATLPGREGRR